LQSAKLLKPNELRLIQQSTHGNSLRKRRWGSEL